MAEESGCDVTEVTARYADDQLVCQALLLHAGVCIEIVECLRQEAGYIDRVGRSQLHVLVQLLVHERRLNQSLAVVENAIYLKGCDVLTEGSELALLNLANLSLWIKHVNVDSLYTEETIGNGRTRITRCCYENVDFLFTFLTNEVLEQASHETGTYILEGECRTMEQLQGVDIWFNLYNRAVECQGIIYNLLQRICIYILAKEGISYLVCNLLEAQLLDMVEEVLWQLLDDFWHIETTVFCQTFNYRLM